MCGTASGWAKMAFLCLVIGMVLHIAGWGTKNWMVSETSAQDMNVGLWEQKKCIDGNCNDDPVESVYETDDFNAVRALETIVFCAVVFSTVLLAIYVFFEGARRQTVAIVLMVLCFLAGTVSFIGMIVWVVTIPSNFIVSFSLGLTVLAFILVFIAGTLLIPDVFEPQDHYTKSRSDLNTPSPRRGTTITPMTYKGNGYHNRW